jgi:2-dehydropantoate 2-reductase
MNSTVTPSPVRALVLGAGAIGALYGHILARAGAEVSVVARSDFDLIAKNGYQIKSNHIGDATFKPKYVIRQSSDWNEKAPDLLLVCIKVLDNLDQVALISSFVGAHTCIILIQNGIDIESPIRAAFPNNEIVSALAFVQVSRTAPGVIEHFSYGELTIGTFPKGIGDGCRKFGYLLEQGGIPGKLTEDVVNARWQKCLWNAPFNPVSAMTGPSKTHTILNHIMGETLIRDMMKEVFDTAAAAGHPLPEGIIDQYVQATKNVRSYKTSMALDMQNGRPMETEAILGNTVRIAKKLGVATPKLDTLYALMKVYEAAHSIDQ